MINYNLNSLIEKGEFLKVKEEIRNQVFKNFGSRKESCILTLNGTEFQMTLGKAFLNFLFLSFFVNCGIDIRDEDLYLKDSCTEDSLNEYFNHLLTRYTNVDKKHFEEFRKAIVGVLDEASDTSSVLNRLAGNTISLDDFVYLLATSEEARKLLKPEIPFGYQFNEVESLFNHAGNDLISLFKSHKELDLSPFCMAETGMNKKQFTQMAWAIGLKPDMSGGVIPRVIRDNFIYGLSSLENYYINCIGTRKALCTNYTYVRKSGYLTRKLSLACVDIKVDADDLDCHTHHTVRYRVDSKEKLKQIIGRHYYDYNEDGTTDTVLKTVSGESTDLIGKEIALRSPCTCASLATKGHVCATCYGRSLAEKNRHLNAGLNAVYILTNPLTQMLLSAKHLLTTKTDKVDFGDSFNEVFTVNLNEVYFNELSDSDFIVEIKEPSSDEYDEDEEMFYVRNITITNTTTHKTFEFESPVNLLLNPKIKFVDGEPAQLSSKTFTDYIFKYVAKNNELTKSLENILTLIESSDHLVISDYSEFVNKFDDLLIQNNLGYILSVQAEIISSVLIRNAETNKLLDFSKKDLDAYKIIRVSKAVMSDAISKSFAFERINEQLADLSTYDKDTESYIDYLFK